MRTGAFGDYAPNQGSERHAALASDLIEEFRVPIVDSLVLWLINTRTMNPEQDFRYQDDRVFGRLGKLS